MIFPGIIPRAVIHTALQVALMSLAGAQVAQPAKAENVLGEVYASDANLQGAVQVTEGGAELYAGDTIDAGTGPATIRLRRGGTLRICAGSRISIDAPATKPNAQELLLSLGTGALQADYTLAAASDAILTPDFRILLAGPGHFHLELNADAHGNTCIRTLPGDTASIVVSELMGEGSYQIKPGEAITFRAGRTGDAVADGSSCGCPVSTNSADVQSALPPSPPVPQPATAAHVDATPATGASANPGGTTQPLPAQQPGEVHVEVDVPFVFSAAAPPPPDIATVASLHLAHIPRLPEAEVTMPQTVAAIPVITQQQTPQPTTKKGFFGRLKSFFGSLFGKKSKTQ